jgi:hypothetical protein
MEAMDRAVPTCERDLIALLRARAITLRQSAPAIGASLERHASDIEDDSKRDEALIYMDRYAHYYKGLIDQIVPGVDQSDWAAFVRNVRKLVREAVRKRGLDRSLIGRLCAFVYRARRAA